MTEPRAAGDEPSWGPHGLLPAIVQDVADGRVLMLAWMDVEAWKATRSTGVAHFHSRSRGRLWRKGETSGNELRVRDVALDCDRDAILLTVDPTGPTCHRGTRSCFDDDAPPDGAREPQSFDWLESLWATIDARVRERPAGSYTTRLLDGGVDATARKVVEEATEVLIAAKDDAVAEGAGTDRAATRKTLADETADLLFHTLVVLAERGTSPAEVIDVLRGRHRG